MRLLDGTFTQRRHVSDSNAVGDAAGTARSVAVIMDGNGRWAEARGLPVAAGHREGTRALRRTVEAAIDMGVHSLAVYAFSTENWARPADEVGTLMEILGDTIDRELPDLARQGVRTRFVGRGTTFPRGPPRTHGGARSSDGSSRHAQPLDRVRLGRQSGARRSGAPYSRGRSGCRDVDEAAVAARLYASELPEIDLLIRTSGELRISNFMLWQAAYAELVFTETLWPEFGAADLGAALEEFSRRQRRFGAR